MLIYLLNSASIPSLDEALKKSKDNDIKDSMITVYKTKKEKSFVDMCTGRAQSLITLCRYIATLDFESTPNYNKIR